MSLDQRDRYPGRPGLRVLEGGAAVHARAAPAPFAELDAYWQGLRRGAALPRRADIDPRGIARLLDRTLLLERTEPGVARVRVAGMALAEVLGMDLRGMPVSALIAPAGRALFAERLEAVFARPCKAAMSLESESGLGQPALGARLLLLPVAGDRGVVDRALGCLLVDGTLGRAPRRFLPEAVCLSPVSGLGTAPDHAVGHLRLVPPA